MKKFSIFLLFLFCCNTLLKSQETETQPVTKKIKGTFYAGWGYNKDWFSKSDLHFKNNSDEYNTYTNVKDNYNFTVYGAKAKDRPGFKKLLTSQPTIPQYVYRIGYYFNDKHNLGIEINFDHAKYVVDDYQTLRVKGSINGQYIDKDTLVDPNFLHFEHTNGANFMMLNLMKRERLLTSKNGKHQLFAIAKPGLGVVIPKTYVVLFGQEQDNRFHVAGWCAGLEVGFRYEAFKHVYLEYTGKGAFLHYTDVLVMGAGKAQHYFWAFENILVLGVQIGW
jgi:hypothetical protein